MANPWFRLYSEIADDPKIGMMPENLRWRFIALLCYRCKQLAVTDASVAYLWRIPPSEARETKDVFMAQGFIDENWTILNWDKRQYVSDSSTERTKKYRDKMKTVTPVKRHSDGVVTYVGSHGDFSVTDV